MEKEDKKILEELLVKTMKEKSEITESFPCGYSYTLRIDEKDKKIIEKLLLKKCPMHGNKCELKVSKVSRIIKV